MFALSFLYSSYNLEGEGERGEKMREERHSKKNKLAKRSLGERAKSKIGKSLNANREKNDNVKKQK